MLKNQTVTEYKMHGGEAPRILYLTLDESELPDLRPRHFRPQCKGPRYPLDWRMCGPPLCQDQLWAPTRLPSNGYWM